MIEEFSHLSQFKNLKDFNNNVEMFLAEHKNDFTKGEYIAFMRLTKFAARVYGVANCKIATLVSSCHDKLGGISRSTAERMIRKAKKLGILTVHNTTRKKGGFAHNVFIFNRFDVSKNDKLTDRQNAQTLTPVKDEPTKSEQETIHPLKTNNNKNINKRNETLDHTFTSDRVPFAFTNLVKCFFDDAKKIEAYWNRVQIAAYRNNIETRTDDVLDIAIDSFKQLIGKMKRSRVRDTLGYFYGILDKKMTDLYFEDLLDLGFNFKELQEDCWLSS